MISIVLLICLLLIYFSIAIQNETKIVDSLLKSVLVFSAKFVCITEVLSLFRVLNYTFILGSWISIVGLTSVFLYLRREKLVVFFANAIQTISSYLKGLSTYDRFLLGSIFGILGVVFIQGVLFPPNNWDSLTYHMARITNWLSHQSVAHYPSHIYRQIYQPPFSEFVILHVNCLNANDYFSNAVQFFFLVFSLFAILAILNLFCISKQIKLVSIVLALTIPEVILQASSTQNDLVVSFFILTAIYFAIKSIQEGSLHYYLYFGLSVGLALLTKGTAYVYLAPVLLIFAIFVLFKIIRTKKHSYLSFALLAACIAICLNVGHFSRNYNLAGNILGTDKAESKMYSNENMSAKLLVSNILKNIGLHLSPTPINRISTQVIYKLHSLAGVDINNSGTNFNNINYEGAPSIPNHEDSAPNSIHFLLIGISLMVIFVSHKNRFDSNAIVLYMGMMALQVILFCLYLKWQPWHTRLHLPLFMLSLTLICYAISLNTKYFVMLKRILPFLIIAAFLIISINYSRPLLSNKFTSKISVQDTRYKKYFANHLSSYEGYRKTIETINKFQYKNIGLIIGGDDWEYPLFSEFYEQGINPIHLNVSNITKNIPNNTKALDCIISTTLNDSIIEYNGEQFYNINAQDSCIWLYTN